MSSAAEPTPVEDLLKLVFNSDPRKAKYPLPEPPDESPEGLPYTISGFLLTPEIARDILRYRLIRVDRTPKALQHEEFRRNRNLRVSTIKSWEKKLLNKEWDSGIHQGIGFTSDGFLIDGQHRCAGVSLSKVSIRINATFNVGWSSFAKMDDTLRRSAGQMLDVPHPFECAAISRRIIPVLRGEDRTSFTVQGATEEVIDVGEGWPFFSNPEWVRAIKRASRSGIPFAPLGASVMCALAAGANEFDVQEFLTGLDIDYRDGFPSIHGDGEDPRFLLRKEFRPSRQLNPGRFPVAEDRANTHLIRRAIHAWLERDSPKEKIRALNRPRADRNLWPVWRGERVREFHAKHVG